MGNIVLDFDGVIIDSFQELLKIFQDFDGSVTKADILDCFDSSIDTQDKRPWQQKEFFEYLFREYPKRINESNFYEGIELILKRLANQHNLFLITSNSGKVASDLLKRGNLNMFKRVLGYEVHTAKTEKFKLLEREGEIIIPETIFITDTKADIIEGNEVGCKVLAETFGYHDKKRLETASPNWIANSWEEIEGIIESYFK